MERRKTVQLRQVMQLFWRENPELYHKMMEARVQRLWGELFGTTIAGFTTKTYIKNRVLYVSMSSSVARNEMASMRKRIVRTLNEHAGSHVIDDVMIR